MSPTSPRPFIWARCAPPPPRLVPQENKQDPDKDQSLYLSALQFFTERATVFQTGHYPEHGQTSTVTKASPLLPKEPGIARFWNSISFRTPSPASPKKAHKIPGPAWCENKRICDCFYSLPLFTLLPLFLNVKCVSVSVYCVKSSFLIPF